MRITWDLPRVSRQPHAFRLQMKNYAHSDNHVYPGTVILKTAVTSYILVAVVVVTLQMSFLVWRTCLVGLLVSNATLAAPGVLVSSVVRLFWYTQECVE